MLAIGSDHGGFLLKEKIIEFLETEGIDFDLEPMMPSQWIILILPFRLPRLCLGE